MLDDLDKNKTLADKKFEEMETSGLFPRMDTDADLANQVPQYTRIPDVDGKEIPNSVYITLDDAAMFTTNIESLLNSTLEQVEVTTTNKRFDTAYVEEFIRVYFKEADKLLPLKDLFPLNPFVDQQTCRRGRTAARILTKIIDDKLVTDITPFDTRYFTYWMDKKGLAGVAYKTTRSKDQIEYEYPNAKVSGDTGIEVMDIWTPTHNEVWVDGLRITEGKDGKPRVEEHGYGYVPVVFHKVPMGSMLLDEDSMKFQGESVFFLIRYLILELNRLVSIIQTFNLEALDAALQLKKPQANIDPGEKVKGHDEVTAPGTVNVVPSEGGYFLMPIGQLQQQAELLHRMIQDRVDRATQTFMQSMLQPKTATEIIGIAQEKGDVASPRLATRGLLKQGLAEMAIKQTIRAAENEKVDTVKMGGMEWDIGKLKGEYGVEFTYSFKDQKVDIARASMASTLRGIIPDKAIRLTLQREDPERDERELDWEEAGRLSPLVKMDRIIRSLLKEADRGQEGAEEEAMMLTAQILPALDQAIAGQMTPEREEEIKPAEPLLPAFSRTGG